MVQVQNLLDLFRQSLPDAQASAAADAKPAPRTVTSQGTAGKSGRSQGDLLPMDGGPSRGGNLGVSRSTSSFQTNMKKSAAKLAAKERTLKERAQKPAEPKAHGQAPAESRAPKAKSKTSAETSAPRNDGTKRANDARDARDDRDARDARSARTQARNAALAKNDSDHAVKPKDEGQGNTAHDTSATQQADSGKNDQPQGLDEKSRAALKKGLADLGIQVDDKQLQDPAFLADIVRMLQAMPAQALPSDDSQSAVTSVNGTDGTDGSGGTDGTAEAGQGAADAGQIAAGATANAAANTAASGTQTAPANPDSQATQTMGQAQAAADAKPQVEVPKTLSRQDLARMLEDRIGGLERAAQGQVNRIQVSAQAPTVTPKEWQGVQARPQAEGPSPDPMPIADLDRLRVMQASALQAAPAKNDASAPRTNLVLESDSVEPTSGPAGTSHVEAGRDATASQNQDAQADLFGGKGDQAGGAQILGKEAAQSVKDGAAGSQFNQVLDQARAIDHRAALAAEVAPRSPLHDTTVLDQIARKMSLTTHKTGDEINIQLTPEHLGRVNVSLEMKENGMSARISVENDSVRKQVEENISTLKDALKDQGIQLQGMEVSVDQRHASLFNPDGSNAESFFRRQGRGNGQGNGGPGTDNAGLESAPESDTGRRWGYNTMEYIG